MNLLIVDDENLIHVSIEYCLKELRADDIMIYHAYNGAEMLETMASVFFDIVLVDIRMPGLSGLEAIRQAKQLCPDSAYYIMTGFSEFEYAREAVHLNVTEYLLKPLEPETLRQIISRAREKALFSRHHIRECLRNWLTAAIHNHNIAALFPEKYFVSAVLLTCDVCQSEAVFQQLHFAETSPDSVLSFPCGEGLLLLLYSKNPNDIYTILGHFSQETLQPSCTAFLSSVCHEADELAGQIQSILRYSPLRVLHGTGKRYHYALFSEPDPEDLLFAGLWIELKDSLFYRQPEKYHSLYREILQKLRERPLTDSQMKNLSHFVSSITEDLFSNLRSDRFTFQDLERFLEEINSSVFPQDPLPDKMELILNYIQKHFCQDISLTEIADKYNLTPNHLGTQLKLRLGMRFTDYLTELRIARAKELLADSSMPIKEITLQVGYYSQSYFTRIFSQKTGSTPAEFRQNNSPGSH